MLRLRRSFGRRWLSATFESDSSLAIIYTFQVLYSSRFAALAESKVIFLESLSRQIKAGRRSNRPFQQDSQAGPAMPPCSAVTCTRLSKKVAPAPRSVSLLLVVTLQLQP